MNGNCISLRTSIQYKICFTICGRMAQVTLVLMKTYKIILIQRSNSTGYKTMLLGSWVLKGMLVSVLFNFSKHQNSSVSSWGQKKFYCQFLFLRVLILIRPVSSAVQISFQFQAARKALSTRLMDLGFHYLTFKDCHHVEHHISCN